LDHPNIVGVTDFGRGATGQPFFIMERLSGVTLHDELHWRGPQTPERAVLLCLQLLRALGAAHGIGVIHRDIKPANLFLHYPPSGGEILKVLDFGVAKVIETLSRKHPAPPALPTRTGILVGTPRYASPEQVDGLAVDYRADLYAAALVLYCLVVGHTAFDKLHEPNLLAAHIDWQQHPPSTFAAHPIPPELDRAILRGLLPNPRERFQSAAEFDAAVAAAVPNVRMGTDPPPAPPLGSGPNLPARDPAAEPTAVVSIQPEAAPSPMSETAAPSTRTAVPVTRTSAAAPPPDLETPQPSWMSVYVVVVACATVLTGAGLAASLVFGPLAVLVATPAAIVVATALGLGVTRHKQRIVGSLSESRRHKVS
jgi:serine/threonine-protein kinase